MIASHIVSEGARGARSGLVVVVVAAVLRLPLFLLLLSVA